MKIAIPYFGDLPRFRPLLDEWFDAFQKLGLSYGELPVTVISDNPDAERAAIAWNCSFVRVDVSGFRDLIRPNQPFDLKGAIVCAFLLLDQAPVLVLDADAVLAQDPRDQIVRFADDAVAMPIDHGALVFYREPKMKEPYNHCRKMCAGVMWFGFARGGRGRLVAGYRRAFEELVALPALPWDRGLSHLVEQYAWSICHHRRGGATLPGSFNWCPEHLGRSELAVINHHYGHVKWNGRPAPANS